jgi:hypothetical protein
MMGPTQEAQAASFYEVLLENHVRQDHLLYAIDPFVDLSDIRQYLAEFYSHNGSAGTTEGNGLRENSND